MASYEGDSGVVDVDSTTIAEVISFSFSLSAGTISKNRLTSTWEQREVGLKSASGTITCAFDDTDTNGQEALTVGAGVTLKLYPSGDGSGQPEYTIPAIVTSIDHDVPAGREEVTRTFGFESSGAVSIADVGA